MIEFRVSKDFEKKFLEEVKNVLKVPLEKASVGIKEEVSIDTQRFRGRNTGISIADTHALASEISSKAKTPFVRVFPIKGMLEVFGHNAQGLSSPRLLFREEDPAWFDFNGIKSNSVLVRDRQDFTGIKPPLGAPQRQFFENAFNRLNDGKIINIMNE